MVDTICCPKESEAASTYARGIWIKLAVVHRVVKVVSSALDWRFVLPALGDAWLFQLLEELFETSIAMT